MITPPPAVCEVPGCTNCSQRFAGQEYLCSRHWPMVPRRLRLRRARLRQRYARRRVDSDRYNRVNMVIWRAMVKAAIRNAAGI